MKILLADDSPAMRAVYRKALEKLGHTDREIVEAHEAREVVKVFQNLFTPIDLVIFDWDLPGMDGLGLMSHLKSLGLTETVAVLLSVNRQQRALLPQATKLGPCESIERPFTEEACETKLRGMGKTVDIKKGESSKKLRVVPTLAEPDNGIPFLLRLPSAVIDDVLKLADERRHDAGAVLLKTGQVSDSLQIVTRGQVEILTTGRPARIVGEGDPVGEFSFMMSEPSTYTARAKTEVLTASLSKDHQFLELRSARPIEAGPQQSYELWLIPKEGDAPLSLAVLGRLDARLIVPAGHRARLQVGATLAVSVEPAGGSPTGAPTGPVILAGAIQT